MDTYGKFDTFAELRSFLHEALVANLQQADRPTDRAKRYRIEHCERVAKIGRLVAEVEGMDAELLELGCLVHDIGKWDAEDPVDHGRAGALIAYDLFTEAELPNEICADLAQGIAMHTDGYWNTRTDGEGTGTNIHGKPYIVFAHEPSVLAQSIGDCDNIDRYSTYRICDTLRYVDFLGMDKDSQREWIMNYIDSLHTCRNQKCATEMAQKMWIENLNYQAMFFKRLLIEIDCH
ncbi:HD domain-containing protein [Arcanobacterium ihumii]|uniref:HD domain-containing protein n=1 Tax=Arcanobacterium ihumii TaxID=2138162 RepID=UPI000F51BA68|nr:HD domain-containing protein [Arcanobacterium ihumii]